MWYSIVEMCMGFIKLQHKSSVFWVIVHVGIVRQMGRHIIASSCSHYCGVVPAGTAGAAPWADAESRPSCRAPGVKVQGRWVRAGWLLEGGQHMENKYSFKAGCQRGRGKGGVGGGGREYFIGELLFPGCVWILRLLGHPEYLGELIA